MCERFVFTLTTTSGPFKKISDLSHEEFGIERSSKHTLTPGSAAGGCMILDFTTRLAVPHGSVQFLKYNTRALNVPAGTYSCTHT